MIREGLRLFHRASDIPAVNVRLRARCSLDKYARVRTQAVLHEAGLHGAGRDRCAMAPPCTASGGKGSCRPGAPRHMPLRRSRTSSAPSIRDFSHSGIAGLMWAGIYTRVAWEPARLCPM